MYINPSVNPSFSPWFSLATLSTPSSRDPRLLRSFGSFPAVVAHGGGLDVGVSVGPWMFPNANFSSQKGRCTPSIGGLPLMFGA